MKKILYRNEKVIEKEVLEHLDGKRYDDFIKKKMIHELIDLIPNEDLYKYFSFKEEQDHANFTTNPRFNETLIYRVSVEVEQLQP